MPDQGAARGRRQRGDGVIRDPAAQPYELRLASLADPRVRDAVSAVLNRWAPVQAGPPLGQTLSRRAITMRLSLGEAEAPALLRDLYATGAAPVAVVLRPVGEGVSRRHAPADSAFAIFEHRGGRFAPTWNWTAFVFGPLWYLRRGLYAKGLVLFGLSVCPFWTLPLAVLVSGVILVYCGVAGNWDDYLWRVKGTQWW